MTRSPMLSTGTSLQSSLRRLLVGSALVGAATLGLSSGSARAVQVCSTLVVPCPPGTTNGAGDASITTSSGPSPGAADVFLDWTVLGPTEFTAAVGVDLNPDLTGPGSTFDYKLAITGPGKVFAAVANNWMSPGGSAGNTMTVYSDSGFSVLIASVLANGGSVDLSSYGLQTVWVRNAYYGSISSPLDAFENVFTVQSISSAPAPLPLLGACAAFGASRRMRRRMRHRLKPSDSLRLKVGSPRS